ncbi:hypothetical protein ACWDHW_14110 [Streptomyces melanosporofaciens]|uniref:hypothetical protein n=1 Tax=unclassified Streptomyces TaxID=2593676 RepID=UPI0036CD95DD
MTGLPVGHLPEPFDAALTDALWLRISQQIVEVAYKLYGEAPKADSVRTLSLSLESADNLVGFRTKQERKRQEWGDAYVETGRVWTHENGEALHPDAHSAGDPRKCLARRHRRLLRPRRTAVR